MKYINHITLNSGHTRKTYPHEVDKNLYFRLRQIYKQSLKPEGAKFFEDYIVKTTEDKIGALVTLFREDMPILTSAYSKNDDGYLWTSMHESSTTPLKTKATDQFPLPSCLGSVLDHPHGL